MQTLKVMFLSTFLMGFLTGVFVYFSNDLFPDISFDSDTNDDLADEDFIIIGEVYGGCQMMGTCPSYRILASGEYNYLLPVRGGGSEVYTDELSRARRSALASQLDRTNFEQVMEREFTGTCPAAYDSAAYRFDITYEGEIYRINTCQQDVANMELFELLVDYFSIFRLTHQGS